MSKPETRWSNMYNQVALCDVPRHYAGMSASPFLMQYLQTVLRLCPQGGRVLETGVGSGYNAIWLSKRGCRAEGLDYAPEIVERARQINNLLEGKASFYEGDLFALYAAHQAENPTVGEPVAGAVAAPYHVIFHQGVLEHFTVPQIRAALAQQVALAGHVVFSVPSVHYPFEPEFGDERLLPLEEWERILSPFDVAELKYYGDPQHGEKEHVLAVLRGGPITPELEAMMQVPAEPYLPGISAIVHTRNEAGRLEECLQSLQGWTNEIIVCDMESNDETIEIARRFTDQIISHPVIPHFDRARNVSAMRASHQWIFYLDADERVPPALGEALKGLTENKDTEFDGLLIPFRHHFAGHWMRSLYPGYTMPRLFRNGRFHFPGRHHAGPQVEGTTAFFPADNPELSLLHFSYDSLSHYLDKLNAYTDGEATSMHREGQSFHWQQAIRHWVSDFSAYYDQRDARQDGVHGLFYSFLSGFYRFEQHAKLYEKRFHAGQLQPPEMAVPESVEALLEYALAVLREKPRAQPQPIAIGDEATVAIVSDDATEQEKASDSLENVIPVVWSGPLLDPSGYGEESRQFLFGLDEHNAETDSPNRLQLSAQNLPWSDDVVELSETEQGRFHALTNQPVAPGFIHITQNFPLGIVPHPQAEVSIGRTMFETDRLPQDWVRACNQLDYVWVPTEFNRASFAAAGVAPEKLRVIPGCLDADLYRSEAAEFAHLLQAKANRTITPEAPFTFLTVFDWTLHKGWDVLLRGFLRAFEGRDDVALVLKVWSTMGYKPEDIQQQAASLIQKELGHDLLADKRIRFVFERLPAPALRALYREVDAFVLPSRGEGWGRPLMEAMATGLPTIGTDWSGNTAFMTPENSYLIRSRVVPVPEIGWREIPTYQGHRWAEPDEDYLVEVLQHLTANRSEAQALGQRAQQEILERYDRRKVAAFITQELQQLQQVNKLQTNPQSSKFNSSRATIPVRWEGAQFCWHSLGLVNRELCLQLAKDPNTELSLIPVEPAWFKAGEDPRFAALEERFFAPLSGDAQVHVRHFFPPRFQKPDEGRLVLIQPWEYGYLPTAWIEPIKQNVDEVWCYSQYVKDVYLQSGVPEDKLQVVPLGVDTDVFHPQALPYAFTDEAGAESLKGAAKPFTFLFTGGTLHRKGIDILLKAYFKAFTALDDVCLVIKDTGTETVYRGGNEREHILELISENQNAEGSHGNRPRVVYLDRDLSSHQLAGLYTAADCLVQPYRGEGFCLPALEAMACGLPVIVPEGGPTDDFIDDTVGWRLPAEHKPFSIVPSGEDGQERGRIGQWDCCGPTWMFEVDADDLARSMRQIVGQPEAVKDKGALAAARAKENWTWSQAAEVIQQRLSILASREEKAPDAVESFNDPLPAEPTRSKATISLCMIARDEERVLGECLASAKPYVDEIILVDTGSNDRTVEIAREHGAKVFHFPWCDDFSAARNESIKHATGDWIFWMDADDTLPPHCGERLAGLAETAEEGVAGFLMQVHIPPAPGEEGFTIVDHLKLFRHLPGLGFEGRIHEQILEPLYRFGGKVERTDLYVVHSGYDYSEEGQTKKRARDLSLLQQDLEERPGHPFVLFNIGMTAHHLKEWDKAIEALEECLQRSKPFESTVRKAYAMLAGSYLAKGDVARAVEKIEKGLSLFPHDPELLFRAGIIYREAGSLPQAEDSYLKLLTNREVGHIDSLDVSMTGFKAHHNLALIYQDMNRWHDAERHYRAAVQDNTRFVPSWLGLGESLLQQGRGAEINSILPVLNELDGAAAQALSRCAGAVRVG